MIVHFRGGASGDVGFEAREEEMIDKVWFQGKQAGLPSIA